MGNAFRCCSSSNQHDERLPNTSYFILYFLNISTRIQVLAKLNHLNNIASTSQRTKLLKCSNVYSNILLFSVSDFCYTNHHTTANIIFLIYDIYIILNESKSNEHRRQFAKNHIYHDGTHPHTQFSKF